MEVLGDIWILAQRSVTLQTLLLQAALDNENFITVAQRALPCFIGVTSRVYYPFPSPLIFFILWSLCPVRLNDKRLITTHKGGGTQNLPALSAPWTVFKTPLRLRGPCPRVGDSSWDAGDKHFGNTQDFYGRFWGGTKSGNREGLR